jgi:protein TonB
MFEQSLIPERRARQPWTFVLAILFQFGLVGLAVLIPLLIVEPPPLEGLVSVLLVPPPPPPPPAPSPPPAIRMVVKTPPRQFVAGKLFEPPSIPRHVAILNDVVLPPPPSTTGIEGGVVGGVPGGVPGGQLDGLLAGILKPVQVVPPPPPTPVKTPLLPEAPKLLRVGGDVEEARLLHEVVPQYPPMARFARLQGAVQFDAVIGTDGKVENLKVVGGPPLLIPAAMQAVRQWVYKPFLLNGEPVAVETRITIKFVLG